MNEPILDLDLDRALPSSPEIERAILGYIFLNNDLMHEAVQQLDADAGNDFYVPSTRNIWLAFVALYRVGMEINPVSVAEELRREGHLAPSDMLSLSNLAFGLPQIASLAQYTKIIRGKSLLRQLVKVASKITSEALEEEDEPNTILEHAEQSIFRLAEEKVRGGRSVMTASDIAKRSRDVMEGWRAGTDTALETPWIALNNLCRGGIHETELWGLLALIKQGKSAWMKQWAQYLVTNGKRVLIFTREMSEVKIFFRMLAPLTDIPSSQMRYGLDENRIKQLMTASRSFEKLGLFIDSKTSTVDEFHARSREMIRLEGIDAIFGDYLQLFKSGRRFDSRAGEVGYVWRAMKDTAQDLNTRVVALAQSSREGFKVERPYFHNAEGSGEAEKSVDVGMVLVTELNKGEPGRRPATIHIDYQRDEDAGTKVDLIFNGRIMEFHETFEGASHEPRY